MSGTNELRVSYKAPLLAGDTETMTVGCRANNPGICKNNGILAYRGNKCYKSVNEINI